MEALPTQQNGKEPDDKKHDRKLTWAGIFLGVLGILLFFAISPSNDAKAVIWDWTLVVLFVASTLALLIAPSLKYHRHYKQWCSNVAALQSAADAITNLKLDEAAGKANLASLELNKAIEQATGLHQKSSAQSQLLNQAASENQKLAGTLTELKSVVPSANGIVHELKVLTGLLLNIPELRDRVYTLSELTDLERGIPNDSTIVIQRPEEIRTKNNDLVTSIMGNNANRGIKYVVIGNDKPFQWTAIPHLEQRQVDEKDPSLVLPSFGLVLYIVAASANGDWQGKYTWCPIASKNLMRGNSMTVAGFVLLPIPHKDDSLEHGYLALRMSGADIDELIHRIFK